MVRSDGRKAAHLGGCDVAERARREEVDLAELAARTLAAQGVPLLVGMHQRQVIGASKREVRLGT